MAKESRLLDRRDCLLVVIDAQEKLMPAVREKETITQNLVRLVKFASIIGMPVVFTEQGKLGPTLSEIRGEVPDAKVVEKITFDCFGCQGFLEMLAQYSARTLILAGVEAHICVAQTALTGLDGYCIQVVGDAVSSRAEMNRDIALKRLSEAGAVVTSTEMVIYELLGKAGTDEFKATLPLVK